MAAKLSTLAPLVCVLCLTVAGTSRAQTITTSYAATNGDITVTITRGTAGNDDPWDDFEIQCKETDGKNDFGTVTANWELEDVHLTGHSKTVRFKTTNGSHQSTETVTITGPQGRGHNGRITLTFGGKATGKGATGPTYCSQDLEGIVPGAGLELWLRGDSGIDKPGGTVSGWGDQSGNGNNAIQAASSQQPSLVVDQINGLPVVRFDGTDDVLGLTGTSPSSQRTICIVEKLSAGAVGSSYYPLTLGGDANVTGQYYGLETRNGASGNSPDLVDVFAGFSNDARAQYPTIAEFGSWRILTSTTDEVIASTSVTMNGARAAISTTGANVSMSVQLGNATGTGFGGVGGTGNSIVFAKCDVAEVLVYNRALSSSEIAQVNDYLSAQYGIPLVTCSSAINDDFADGSLAPLWVQVGNCGPAVETGGALALSTPASCGTPSVRGVVGVQSDPTFSTLCGNFDVRVDFNLTNFPVPSPSNARYSGLLLKAASDPIGVAHVAACERYLQNPTDGCTPFQSAYKFFGSNSDNCAASWVSTTDAQGSFRIVRINGWVRQYYWNGSGWTEARVSPITSEPLSIVLYSGTTSGDPQEIQFDNLTLATATVSVPGIVDRGIRTLAASPNPGPGFANLEWKGLGAGKFELGVFDLSGRRVRSLAKGLSSSGSGRVTWNGCDDSGRRVRPSIYYAKLASNGRVQTTSIVLMSP